MPSLTYGVRFGAWKSRSVLVSFSVKSSVADPSAERNRSPRSGCEAAITPEPACRSPGRGASPPHDQVLRNQRVGSTWSVAASGPRLATVISTRRSSGDAFAYSTNTSK